MTRCRSEAQGALEEFQARSKDGQKGRFQSVLERLLRLRQTCNHWTLCKERIADLLALLEDQDVVPLTDKNRALLQQALQLVIESQEECPVCMENMVNPVITHCKHVYCRGCITKVIDMQAKCPMCRAALSLDHLLEPAPETSSDDEEPLDQDTKSSKTEALLKILQATLKNDGSKVIVFSQWTSFLNVIQRQLDDAGYTYTRVDGSMPTAKRDAALRALDDDPNTRVMLASLGVCSVGLNLVAADTVVLADSCKQRPPIPTHRHQANAHRVGPSNRRPGRRPSPSPRADAADDDLAAGHGGDRRGAGAGYPDGEARAGDEGV